MYRNVKLGGESGMALEMREAAASEKIKARKQFPFERNTLTPWEPESRTCEAGLSSILPFS
jgi:hypothetical protein